MDYRPLYRVLDPESRDPAARIFRVVHHALAAFGIAIVLAETMEPVQADYGQELAAGFYIVGGFFIAEYLLRLIAAPAKPGPEHLAAWRARALWSVSPGGIFDLICALPGVLFMTERSWASFFGFIWASKYVRYSPGLASLGRVARKAAAVFFPGVARLRNCDAYGCEHRLSPGARGQPGGVRLDPRRAVVGDRHVDDDRLWRRRALPN